MSTASDTHPFDEAVRLTLGADGRWAGHTHPAYANMIGPFGGITAATLLNAACRHPARIGEPVALTVNYAGPVADGGFDIEARPLRTNRSTQHWSMLQSQAGEVTTSASAVFALRRDSWSSTEVSFPQVPPADSLPRLDAGSVVPWTRQYDMRFVRGALFDRAQPVEAPDSHSIVWLRDEPPRPLDVLALASICDAFFPRILLRLARRLPFGTVSLTTHFHADAARLAAVGTRPLLGTARAAHFGRGYHDQTAEVWTEDGELLATSHQIVYFKD